MKQLYYFIFIVTSMQVFSQSELNVMSYNIRLGSANDGDNNWEIRKEKVADLLNYYEASFIGLQEVQKFQLDFTKVLDPYMFFSTDDNDDDD